MKFSIGYIHGRDGRKLLREADDDGTIWREATTQEIADASPDTLLYWGKPDTDPVPKSTYGDLYLPGDYPFLIGISQLIGGIYIKVADSRAEYFAAHPLPERPAEDEQDDVEEAS